MSEIPYDLVVVGGGPAGYVGAIRAAQLGRRVAVVEQDRAGGTCLNWGCIPTKALIRNAEVYRLVQRAEDFGIQTGPVTFDWSKIIARSRGVSDRIVKGVELLLKKNKVDFIQAPATLRADRSILAGGKTLHAEKVLLATGARPRLIPGFVPDGRRLLTSREAMVIPEKPGSILVIGGGSIGAEFAWFFAAYGTKVTLVESLPSILPREDHEISAELTKIFKRNGMNVLTATTVKGFRVLEDGVEVDLAGANPSQEKVDAVLCAIGLEAVLDVLEEPGLLSLENGFVKTDDRYQTAMPGVFAAGDLIGPPWLAHVASYQAIQAVEGMFTDHAPNRAKIYPSCLYTHPQIASAGLTENHCRERNIPHKTAKYPFLSSGKALASGDNQGFVKLVHEEPTGRLLGCHIIGGDATELIAEMALAMNFDLTAQDIADTIHAHPTLSEVIFEAAEASLGRAIHA